MTAIDGIEVTSTQLTPELLDLMEHEKVIEQGLSGFVDVAQALLAIRDGKKYRAAKYATFEDYCDRRWDFSRSQGHRLIAAAETATILSPVGDIHEPRSERQMRPLAPLREEPEKANEAWALAVEEAHGGQPTARQVEDAVEKVTKSGPAITKPDLGGGVSHPARFSDPLLPIFAEMLAPGMKVLDPFAGTGKIHRLREFIAVETVGVEIEPEWADMHDDTNLGNALALDFPVDSFDAIVTSPTYGNRLADHHNAADPELRRSYKHDLGRDLDPDNSGQMHWGEEYRDFHKRAWSEADRVLRPGGRFVLNIKDHIRGGDRQYVTDWHVGALRDLGLLFVGAIPVGTSHLKQGANAELRAGLEMVIAFDKP